MLEAETRAWFDEPITLAQQGRVCVFRTDILHKRGQGVTAWMSRCADPGAFRAVRRGVNLAGGGPP
ncbi:MAG: hypothetical protein AAF183_05405 [Pseudomonadota bacterium]